MKFSIKRYDNRINIYSNKEIKDNLLEISISLLCNDNYYKKSFIEEVKSDKGRQVFRLDLNNKIYYLKKYSYRRISKRVKNLFRSAEGVRAYQIAQKLLTLDIPVVKAIAAITYRSNIWTVDSIFITEGFLGVDLQEYLANGDYDQRLKENVIKEAAKLWARLYKTNFLNGDPNLPGILIRIKEDNIKLSLVDMDNFKEYSSLSWKKIIKNLIDFNAHSYSGLDKLGGKRLNTNDRILFFKELIKEYGVEIDVDKTIAYIREKTIERLIEWGREEVVTDINQIDSYS